MPEMADEPFNQEQHQRWIEEVAMDLSAPETGAG
jgi:hypothetical protein